MERQKKMATSHAWRNDNRLTAMMVDDFIHDPILAAKVILNVKLPPHQELRLAEMWTTHFTMDDSGFSTGKSFTLGLLSALRSCLFPNRISGIISGTFRQGQLIFQNYDRWYSSSKIFRSCVKTQQGRPRITHGTSAWEIHFRGGATIRALPPNFDKDSERLRSERWHDGYFDEWTIFNIASLTKTLFGRVTALNDYQDDKIMQNHIHCMSTPGFRHDRSYTLVKSIDSNIARGNKDYARFTSNYRHVPVNKKEFQAFVDRRTIFTMQTTNPDGVVKSEIDGRWQKDSMSFYSSKDIDARRRQNSPMLLQRRSDNDMYVAGYDTARGGSDHTKSSADDFSISVLKISDLSEPPQHCLTIRKNNIQSEHMAGIIQELHKKFQFSFVCYDPGGGGLFVRDELRKTEIPIRGKIESVIPMVELGDPHGLIGDNILVPFKRGDFFINALWGKMASDSVIVNRMHRAMRDAISTGNIILPGRWNGWEEAGGTWDVGAKREYLNRAKGMAEADVIRAEMDITVEQLIQVDIARHKDKSPSIDTYGMYKFKSKNKKDSAYGLLYSFVAYSILKALSGKDMPGRQGGSDLAISIDPI
jgi:hypothetical protein